MRQTLKSACYDQESCMDRTGICNQSLSRLFTLSAVAVNTDSRRFNLCHLVSLCGGTLGRGNRGTACRRQEGGDEVGGGQSEAPKGSERGLSGQSVSSWPNTLSAPSTQGSRSTTQWAYELI